MGISRIAGVAGTERALWRPPCVGRFTTASLHCRSTLERATATYGSLLDATGLNFMFGQGGTISFATTNYDPAIEMAMRKLGRTPDDGQRPIDLSRRAYSQRGWLTVPTTRSSRLCICTARSGGTAKVLIQPRLRSIQRTNHTTTPWEIQLPNARPQEGPARDNGVRALWGPILRIALERATHVLVLGHSLNDPVLVDYLRSYTAEKAKLAVMVFSGMTDAKVSENYQRITAMLPRALVFKGASSPILKADEVAFANWFN